VADFDLVFSKSFLKLKFKALRHTFWGIMGSEKKLKSLKWIGIFFLNHHFTPF
jgi:hypothetical protein